MAVPIWPKNGVTRNDIPLYTRSTTRGEIDLRQEMKDLLVGTDYSPQRGHWVLLRRMARSQKCTCWNKLGHGDSKYYPDNVDGRKYDEPEERCDFCDGNGWTYKDELHLVRRRLVAPPIGLAGEEQGAPIGLMNVQYIVYYFQYYVNPHKEDKIIEINLNSSNEPVTPYVHREIHDISVAEPFRDINGRIEYWRCSVKMEVI